MKRIVSFAVLMLLMIIAIAPVAAQECDDAIGCVEIGPDDPITIAYMLTTSGATSFLGEDSVGGIELAVLERDETLLGRDIEVVGEDSLCSAEGGQTAAQRVAADEEILGVIGTSCSSAGTAALPIISEAGMLMISPTNTAPALTDDGENGTWLPGYYRTAHNDLFQGRVAAEFVYNELGKVALATIHDGSPYADGLQAVMADVFGELGGEVVFQGAVNIGDTDMTAILTEIASQEPDVIYLPIFEPESNFVVAQSASIPGLEGVTLITADASQVASFPGNTGAAALGMYLSGPYVDVSNEAYADFLAMWDEEIGGVPPAGFHAHAYDATNMLLDAIEAVAVELEDGSILVGRQALRDALSATEGFEGLTGTLSCGPTGDCATGEALAIFQITQAEIDGNWPPPVVYLPGIGMVEMMEESE